MKFALIWLEYLFGMAWFLLCNRVVLFLKLQENLLEIRLFSKIAANDGAKLYVVVDDVRQC